MLRQTILKRYYIMQFLGRGAFGETWLAEDQHLPDRPQCVVKKLSPQSHDPAVLQEARRLFDREATTLYQLGQHDQIPRLLAHCEENQQFYLVQEFIPGHDLKQELPPGSKLTEDRVIAFLVEILTILEFVHQQGVIHRDIKPSNLMRRQGDGKIVLIDFGAVKQISTTTAKPQGQSPTGQSPTIIGTPGYMPPEQGRGQPNYSSDIYAVGMVGIQALTGSLPINLPIDPSTLEVIWRNRAQVNSQLANILDKMVRHEDSQRYQSATEALQALRKLKNPLGAKSRLILLIVLILLGLAGVIGWRIFTSQQDTIEPEQPHAGQTITAHTSPVYSVAISPDGETIASASQDKTVKLWSRKTGTWLGTFSGHAGSVNSVAISPDGQTIVSGSEDKTIKLWNLKTGELIRTLTGHADAITSVAISPDGQTIVSGSKDKTIKRWNLNTGQLIRTFTGHAGWVEAVAISPDSQMLVSSSRDSSIKLWNPHTGQLLDTLFEDWVIYSFAISPDMQTLVSSGCSQKINLWNLNNRQLRRNLQEPSSYVCAVAISPDGKTIFGARGDGKIQQWDLQTGSLLGTIPGSRHLEQVAAVAISPDGKTIVSGSLDKTIKIWQVPGR